MHATMETYKCARQFFIKNTADEHEGWPFYPGGTGFFVTTPDESYFVTANHCLFKPGEQQSFARTMNSMVLLEWNDERGEVASFTDCTFPNLQRKGEPEGPSNLEANDFFLMRLARDQRPRLRSALPLLGPGKLHTAAGLLKPGDELEVYGFPFRTGVLPFDPDNRCITVSPSILQADFKQMDPKSPEIGIANITNGSHRDGGEWRSELDGFSGSPVFVRRGSGVVKFAGLAITAGGGLLRFIHGQVLAQFVQRVGWDE